MFVFPPSTSITQALPASVAQTPDSYRTRHAIWGGQVISVQHVADHSEVLLMAYPLDGSQRPDYTLPGDARFIAVFPGYVEPRQCPIGTWLTVAGEITGSRPGTGSLSGKTLPVLSAARAHHWQTKEM